MRRSASRCCTGSRAGCRAAASCWSESIRPSPSSAGRSCSSRCSASSTSRSICAPASPRCAARPPPSPERNFHTPSKPGPQRRPAMEVILLERVGRLGHMGDIVRVKDGFARNFLLPKGKALRATKENKAKYEVMKGDLEVRNVEMRGEAQKIGGGLDGKSFVVLRQASEGGQLYGSVSGRDLATILNEAGFTSVTRGQIALNAPIKNIGLHKVPVALHPEVEINITINVARSADEAERIARGENVIARRDDDEGGEAVAAEAFFEKPTEEGEDGGAASAAATTDEGKAAKASAEETGDAKPARKPRKPRGETE